MAKILVTGGAGFIGSNFVHYWLRKYPRAEIVVLDKLTYAGRLENLQEVRDRIRFIRGDICNREDLEQVGDCDFIFNFAAESHVDRSIAAPGVFVSTDVLGAYQLLEYAREHKVKRFIQISTDEVYGSIEQGSFSEDSVLNPSSPYSASKAGADLLALAFFKTYGLPVLITRSSNNFGPRQYPEKFIPLLITHALLDKPLPIYGDGLNVRDWLYVGDNCSAIDLLSQKGEIGQVYNIASGDEGRNIDIANLILGELNKPRSLIHFVPDRPGHDRRYSLDCARIARLGWKPEQEFGYALKKTLQWYKENEWWWRPLV